MSFGGLTFADSGMYQCVAENRHGVLHANAELRVFGESKAVTLKGQRSSQHVDIVNVLFFPRAIFVL